MPIVFAAMFATILELSVLLWKRLRPDGESRNVRATNALAQAGEDTLKPFLLVAAPAALVTLALPHITVSTASYREVSAVSETVRQLHCWLKRFGEPPEVPLLLLVASYAVAAILAFESQRFALYLAWSRKKLHWVHVVLSLLAALSFVSATTGQLTVDAQNNRIALEARFRKSEDEATDTVVRYVQRRTAERAMLAAWNRFEALVIQYRHLSGEALRQRLQEISARANVEAHYAEVCALYQERVRFSNLRDRGPPPGPTPSSTCLNPRGLVKLREDLPVPRSFRASAVNRIDYVASHTRQFPDPDAGALLDRLHAAGVDISEKELPELLDVPMRFVRVSDPILELALEVFTDAIKECVRDPVADAVLRLRTRFNNWFDPVSEASLNDAVATAASNANLVVSKEINVLILSADVDLRLKADADAEQALTNWSRVAHQPRGSSAATLTAEKGESLAQREHRWRESTHREISSLIERAEAEGTGAADRVLGETKALAEAVENKAGELEPIAKKLSEVENRSPLLRRAITVAEELAKEESPLLKRLPKP